MICWKTSFKSRVLWVLSLVSLTLFFWATTFGPMRYENYAVHRDTSGNAQAVLREIAGDEPIHEVMVNFSAAPSVKHAEIRGYIEQLRSYGEVYGIEDLGVVQFAGRKQPRNSVFRRFRVEYSSKKADVWVTFVTRGGKYWLSGLEVAQVQDRTLA